jgi:putative transposase
MRACGQRGQSLLLTVIIGFGRVALVPRPLRIQYEGARYHVLSRGDRREAIFCNAKDRELFLLTLGQTCRKTGWQMHAYCLMSNHFHLVLETPQANLAVGMKWLLGTYTQRFNRRHRHWGHLFGGRYKAHLIDERSPGYLSAAANYVHLNPVRAELLGKRDPLQEYVWSSYPGYLRPRVRPQWLRVDRVLGEHGIVQDSARGRREFSRRMQELCLEAEASRPPSLVRGWKLGAEDFADWLAEKLARRGRKGERAAERRETDQALAERLVREGLRKAKWTERDLQTRPKSDRQKIKIARQLREQTPMSRQWIATRLRIGSPSYLSALLSVDSKL